MLEIIDTIKISGLQVQTGKYLNPISISLNTNNVIQQLTKYNKCRYRFVLENFLSSSNFENDTDVIFLTCNGLSNAKKALINSKIEKVLGVTYLSKIVNWDLAKGQTKILQTFFVDLGFHTNPSHLAIAFITGNIIDLINFTVTLLDGNEKKLTSPSNEKKIPKIGFRIEIVRQKNEQKNEG